MLQQKNFQFSVNLKFSFRKKKFTQQQCFDIWIINWFLLCSCSFRLTYLDQNSWNSNMYGITTVPNYWQTLSHSTSPLGRFPFMEISSSFNGQEKFEICFQIYIMLWLPWKNVNVVWRSAAYTKKYRMLQQKYFKKNKYMWTDLQVFKNRRCRVRHCVKSVQMLSYFWSVFSCIRTEYGDLLRTSPYSVRIQENTNQK